MATDSTARILHAGDADFETRFRDLLARRATDSSAVSAGVRGIVDDVRRRGDAAVLEYTRRFDGQSFPDAARLRVEPALLAQALASCPDEVRAALELAAARIRRHMVAQMPPDARIPEAGGIVLGWRWNPLDSVGIYVPGGSAAYPSSVLMSAIPASVAGVERLAMVCPPRAPRADGIEADGIEPVILAAARIAGVREVYSVGGAQAIAALAYGTKTIRPVDKIVGPGNAYVAMAKQLVAGQVGIDLFAGPSEVLILADASTPPAWTAMDALAQAEHDPLAQAVVITCDDAYASAVATEIAKALPELPRRAVAARSWEDHGAIIVTETWNEALNIVNRVAPEHLQLSVANSESLLAGIRHAGAIFLGANCPEAIGDYVAGPSHVLPTGGTARFASGLSVFDFLKRTSIVRVEPAGIAAIGPAAACLADVEKLDAHARSIRLRIERSGAGSTNG